MSNGNDGLERRHATATKNSQFITNTLVGVLSLLVSIVGFLAWDIKNAQDGRISKLELVLESMDTKLSTLTGLFGDYQVRQENRLTGLEFRVGNIEKRCDRECQ